MAQKWLGKGGVPFALASGIHFSLKNAGGITFASYENGGAQTITIKESQAGANETPLAVVTDLFNSDGVGSVITRDTDDANGALGTGDAAIVKKDDVGEDQAVFYIGADQLSDGFDSVEVTVNAGTLTAIIHDLLVQRAPENLSAFV